MRKVLWLFVFLALLYCGWWGLASVSVTSGLQNWLDTRRSDGWQADVSAIRSEGFPNEIRTVLEAPAFADPNTGLAVKLDQLTLALRTIWPGDVRLLFPDGPINFATPEQTVALHLDTSQADLNLTPGPQLELENLSFTSGPFRIDGPDGGLIAGDASELRMQQTEIRETYYIALNIGQFTPGAVPRGALAIPDDWPLVFTAFQVKSEIRFDRPWDRQALEERRPQPRHIQLQNMEAHWGDVRLRIKGIMDVDPLGIVSGNITIRAENWEAMLDIAETSGVLPTDLRQTAQGVLSSLAAGSGKTNDLDVTLTLDSGLIRLGFIPLGSAPRVQIR
ncbi:MAG: DUF2125 domain-containing protein [Aliishimia sp.]